MGDILWTTAFLDVPAAPHAATTEFWSAVTGYAASEPRGDHLEFATLVPPAGDAHLRIQRTGDDEPRIHLDLHVPDPRAAADRAVGLGAIEVADRGYVVLRSPGGLPFCFVDHPASVPAPPATWADGATSVVDQVCLDLPAEHYDDEVGFWVALTGWTRTPSPGHDEFERLEPDNDQQVRFLLQRLGEDAGPARAHLDLACSDREPEVRRHVRLGAQRVRDHAHWTVLRDPSGAAYCLTDRDPA